MAISNLYPPIVESYGPAFIVSNGFGTAKIYYSISQYNILSDIKSIWVSITNQYTNESMLNSKHKTGLLYFDSLQLDVVKNKYYIEILEEDLKNNEWLLNQYYKIQIRFGLKAANKDELNSSWIIQNSDSFSEWSTVCLIKAIEKPVLILKNFENVNEGINETIISSLNSRIIGTVVFKDNEELESYQLFLYKKDDLNNFIYNSGILYPELKTNEINHFINYGFLENEQYILKIKYTTMNQYSETNIFNFIISAELEDSLNVEVEAFPNNEKGCATVQIKNKDNEQFLGNLIIQRASSETDFKIWNDIFSIPITKDFYNNINKEKLEIDLIEENNKIQPFVIWEDYTIESGIFYSYRVQKRIASNKGAVVTIAEPIIVTFQDMFLVRNNKQLRIEFNPKISSYKRNFSDSVTQTIGGKYPFIKRNGQLNYRQFSISGLISHFCNNDNTFILNENLYHNQYDLYLKYNKINKITPYNDFTLERLFRNEVEKFLTENNVKLFKSPSEGNILVRLTDVSLTPQETLGRMLYSFSATAHEIDELNFNNLEYYGIHNFGTIKEDIVNEYIQHNRRFQGILFSHEDLINKAQLIENNYSIDDKIIKKVKFLSNLKIDIQSEPYFIYTGEKYLRPFKEGDNELNRIKGFLIKINNESKPFFISPYGVYNLDIEDIQITNLFFVLPENIKDIDVTIDYDVFIIEQQKEIQNYQQLVYFNKFSQVSGFFYPDENIVKFIKAKHEIKTSSKQQIILAINQLKIEAEPQSIFYLKESNEDIKSFEISSTGYLNLENNMSIEKLYYYGLKLNNTFISKGKYNGTASPLDGEIYTINDIENLPSYDINYIEENKYKATNDYMWVKNYWHPIVEDIQTGDKLVLKPSNILIDYYCEIERSSI